MQRLLLASLIWAPSFGLLRRHLVGIDPDLVALLRMALGAVVLAPFLPRTRLAGALVPLLLGSVQFGAMYALYVRAYAFLEGHEVALLTATTPLWVLFLERLRGVPLGRRAWPAALVATAGAALLVAGRPELRGALLHGALLVQGANLCFAAGQVGWRARLASGRCRDLTGEHALAYLGACLVLLPATGFEGLDQARELGTVRWMVLAYLGLVASGLGFLLWNTGAARVDAARLAVWNDLKAPLAVLASLLVFHEPADPLRVVASLLLLGLALRLASPSPHHAVR